MHTMSCFLYGLFQDDIAEMVGILWMLFQPLLFGLIGAAVNFDNIKDLNSLGKLAGLRCILFMQRIKSLGETYSSVEKLGKYITIHPFFLTATLKNSLSAIFIYEQG